MTLIGENPTFIFWGTQNCRARLQLKEESTFCRMPRWSTLCQLNQSGERIIEMAFVSIKNWGCLYHLYCGLKATLMALPYGVFVSSLGPNWSWWGLLSGSLWLFFCFNFEIYVHQHIQTRTLAAMRVSKGQWLTRLGEQSWFVAFSYICIFFI